MIKKIIIIISGAIFALSIIAALLYFGVLQMNYPSLKKYPVRGVDVSHYQGEIDWEILSNQNISFAYIKATEGSSYEDDKFQKNWSEASKTELRIGAYHFFSFESAGLTQAENFIDKVYVVDNMLPPVVDVEPYGPYIELSDDDSKVLEELGAWLEIIENHYGMKPVIYTTEDYYDTIRSHFNQYDIWIRSVYSAPQKEINWKIWQYSNRMKLDGYFGDESYIDMNVFLGTKEEFEVYGK